MDALFRVEMLGRFGVRHGTREITRFRTQKTASLLAYLVLYRSRVYPRDVLIELFWPGSELKAARSNLSVALHALRRQLEPPGVPAGAVLIADHTQVRLNPIAFVTDVEAFETALREAEQETEAAKRLTAWMTAVDLFRGDLMPGFYDDWVLTERDRLRDAYLAALRQTVKGCAEARQHERAIEYARRLVQADPLREESHRTLMRLLTAVGRPHEALYQYQELERLLQNQLQSAPSAASRELAAQLSHLPPIQRKILEVPTSDSPQRESDTEIPSSMPDASRPTLRIPLQFTRFFGREEEIARLTEGLYPTPSSSGALFTLTGPGGSGKTRLSIEVARQVKEVFPGGLWFVPLAEVDDPMRLGETLRDTLELPRQSSLNALDQVIAFLRGLEEASLLILDNFEQITAGGAPIVWTLLNRVPQLRCLVTSRRPLALPGEREIPVLPLPVPLWREEKRNFSEEDPPHPSLQKAAAPSEWMAYPSVALFVDRAQAVRPEFQITPRNAEAIAALCEKLEGIPLAIELAAARAGMLTPVQILDRLAQRFELLASRQADKNERHRSLWAAIEWSYHLLSPELQRLFARTSIFRGGWTLDAAESVCAALGSVREEGKGTREEGTARENERVERRESRGERKGNGSRDALSDAQSKIQNPKSKMDASSPASNSSLIPHPSFLAVLDGLAQLRSHSLVQAEESSTAIRFRMLETLREFAGEQLMAAEQEELARRHAVYFQQWVAGARLAGPERTAWFERFEEDFDNLRAVLAWSLLPGNDLEIGLQTAGSVGNFWWLRGHIAEGRTWYTRLLEHAGDTPTVGLSKSLHVVGTLAYMQGDFQAARALLERGLEVSRAVGAEQSRSASLETLGCIAYREGDYAQARSLFEKALKLARTQELGQRVASVLGNMANVAQSSGDFATSRVLNEESLERWRAEEDRNGEARTLHNLGNLAQSQGQLAEARAFYEQSLKVKRELADRHSATSTLRGIAEVAVAQGDYGTAAALARESLALAREQNARSDLVEVMHMMTDFVQAIGELEIAARMYGALEGAREEMGYPLPPVDKKAYEQVQATVCDALGTAVYDAAKTEGRKQSLEEALVFLEDMLARRML